MAGSGINSQVAVIRIIAFGLLVMSVFVGADNNQTVLDNTVRDPFWLGALGMCLSWLYCYIHQDMYINNINITHAAMTFFIITKIISQIEHGGHYGPWGKLKVH